MRIGTLVLLLTATHVSVSAEPKPSPSSRQPDRTFVPEMFVSTTVGDPNPPVPIGQARSVPRSGQDKLMTNNHGVSPASGPPDGPTSGLTPIKPSPELACVTAARAIGLEKMPEDPVEQATLGRTWQSLQDARQKTRDMALKRFEASRQALLKARAQFSEADAIVWAEAEKLDALARRCANVVRREDEYERTSQHAVDYVLEKIQKLPADTVTKEIRKDTTSVLEQVGETAQRVGDGSLRVVLPQTLGKGLKLVEFVEYGELAGQTAAGLAMTNYLKLLEVKANCEMGPIEKELNRLNITREDRERTAVRAYLQLRAAKKENQQARDAVQNAFNDWQDSASLRTSP
jgi:hypothetical protein